MVESMKENDTRIAILQEFLTTELKLKDNELKLKDKEIQMLTKEILQQRGLFDARGVFVRVVIEVFAEQKMKGI